MAILLNIVRSCNVFVSHVSVCSGQRDVVFVFDVSASLEKHIDMMVSFVKTIVQGLSFKFGRTRVGFVTFARDADTRFYLDEHTSLRDVLNALSISEVGYGTNMAAALRHAANDVFRSSKGERTSIPNVCILLSDGRATIARGETEAATDDLKAKVAEVYTVGIGNAISIDTMNKIASDPQTSYALTLREQSDIDSVAGKMLDQLCS